MLISSQSFFYLFNHQCYLFNSNMYCINQKNQPVINKLQVKLIDPGKQFLVILPEQITWAVEVFLLNLRQCRPIYDGLVDVAQANTRFYRRNYFHHRQEGNVCLCFYQLLILWLHSFVSQMFQSNQTINFIQHLKNLENLFFIFFIFPCISGEYFHLNISLIC